MTDTGRQWIPPTVRFTIGCAVGSLISHFVIGVNEVAATAAAVLMPLGYGLGQRDAAHPPHIDGEKR